MRFFGRDVRLFARLPDAPDAPPGAELGRDGHPWVGRVADPDSAPELNGAEKFRTYDEMRKTDAAVKSLLWMLKLPIRSAAWDVTAASEAPIDEAVADFVRWNLGVGDEAGQMAQSWGVSVDQALLALAYGSMFEELVWGDVVAWRDADGDEHPVRPLAQLAPRRPASVRKVEVERGRVVSIEQWLPDARPIPGEKLAYYALEPDGGWSGTSVLRPAFGPWVLKKQLMIAAGIGWDRFSAGIPVVRYPEGGGQAEKDKAEDIGRSIRLHERAYVALEGAEPTAENGRGWGFKIEGAAHTLPDPVRLLRWYSQQIATAGLQQFTSLGTTETGSRAVGEVLAEPFYLALQTIAGELARERTRQVVRRLVDVNFGPRFETPTLTVSKIEPDGLPALAELIGDLAAANVSFADPLMQEWIRERFGFPPLPEGGPAAAEGDGPAGGE